MAEPGARFPSECRRFLARLAEQLDAIEVPEHARDCASCHRVWRAGGVHAGLLRDLPVRAVPIDLAAGVADVHRRVAEHGEAGLRGLLGEAMRSPVSADDLGEELAAIHQRVAEELAQPHRTLLTRAWAPVRPPRDAVWVSEQTHPEVVVALRALRRKRAPAWLWRRIRARTEEPVAAAPISAPVRLGLVAAALLAAFVFWFQSAGSGAKFGGTTATGDIVWDVRSAPIAPSLSLHSFMELGR